MAPMPRPVTVDSFDWDDGNIEHILGSGRGISLEAVEEVFLNSPVWWGEGSCNREARYIAVGRSDDCRLLSVVFTLRGQANNMIRPITAIDAPGHHVKTYKKQRGE